VPWQRELGLVEQTLRNWVKAAKAGKLNVAVIKVVTPEQMELSRLRAEDIRLQRQCEILKSGGVLREGFAMRYAWIDAHRRGFELAELWALVVSSSGYRAWKRGGSPNRKRLTDAQRLALIQAIDQELKGAYGSPRMVRELRDRGFPASKERVEPA
jgi:transposase-like protein